MTYRRVCSLIFFIFISVVIVGVLSKQTKPFPCFPSSAKGSSVNWVMLTWQDFGSIKTQLLLLKGIVVKQVYIYTQKTSSQIVYQ